MGITKQERAKIWCAEIQAMLRGEQTWKEAKKRAEKRARKGRGNISS